MDQIEIERKWLIKIEDIPYDLTKLKSVHIDQSYITFSPAIRIRNIDFGQKYIMTVKTHDFSSELSRSEHEFEISEKDYDLLMKQTKGSTISKTRYLNELDIGLVEEIDVFEGALQGLAYLEIEFKDEKTALEYVSPKWYYKDVTYDRNYKNSALALNGIPKQQSYIK